MSCVRLLTIAVVSTILLLDRLQNAEGAVVRKGSNKRVVCYHTNWSAYRTQDVKFTPDLIDPQLCTHLLYAFITLDTEANSLKPADSYQDITLGGFKKFTDLKNANPDLKTLVSVGGWNEGSVRFSALVGNAEKRSQFVKNTVGFLREHNFDGLDLVWQYPTFREGGTPEDKRNYAFLIKELRDEFEAESIRSGQPRLLLSVVVSGLKEYIRNGFDVPTIDKYIDFINMVAYDYYTSSGPIVNHHAPLYPLKEVIDDPIDSILNADASIRTLLAKGLSPDKINMGIPTYGRLFNLENPQETDPGSAAQGGGNGNTTSEAGYIPYLEICANIKKGGWTVKNYNSTAMGPYAFKDKLWVGYDDEASAKMKGRYARNKGLGGIMFWTIDHDDFHGNCNGIKNPLIRAGREGITGLPPIENKKQKPQTLPTDVKLQTLSEYKYV